MSSYIYDWQGVLPEEETQVKVLKYVGIIANLNHRIFSSDSHELKKDLHFSGIMKGKFLVRKGLFPELPKQVSDSENLPFNWDFSFIDIAIQDRKDPSSAEARRKVREEAEIKKDYLEVDTLSFEGVRFKYPCHPGDYSEAYELLPSADYIFLNLVSKDGRNLRINKGQIINIWTKEECLASKKFSNYDLVVEENSFLSMRHIAPVPVFWLNHFIKAYFIPNLHSSEHYYPFETEKVDYLKSLGEAAAFQFVLDRFVVHWTDALNWCFEEVKEKSEFIKFWGITSKEEINIHNVTEFIQHTSE
ncbi:MAG: hypothetical protein IPP06_09720 [Saprospiraceae bacterium]|nr:hypothetical protein [Candidatus Vicinibacter affinis]